jgi:uncharacterized protein (TIGR00369 family)
LSGFEPGERFHDAVDPKAAFGDRPHIWKTLDYDRMVWEPGRQVVGWKATEEHGFITGVGHIIHGGMVATVLDTAMGGACWSLLDSDEVFLTADLRVEFLRAARPGPLRADGRVLRRARRVMFCTAELFDERDALLATARCTQVILPASEYSGDAT